MSPERHSALYVGRVRHRRLRPKPHDLSYRVWHLAIDIDELAELDRRVRGFGHNRRALVEFRDSDHFVASPGGFSGFGGNKPDEADRRPVRDKLRDLLAARGKAMPEGRITVLTYPRVLGFVFNPVSFWYCHEVDGSLALIVAEVNNTFGDQWSYLLDDLEALPGGGVRAHATKVLHVSPFLPVEDHAYVFTIRPPEARVGSRAAVHMDVLDDAGRILDATLAQVRQPLTSRSMLRALVTHPVVTLHTVVSIHWQAAKIFLGRKARFHRRPEPPKAVTITADRANRSGDGCEPTASPAATPGAVAS